MTADPRAFAVCIAWDAFRLCIGMRPKNFTADEIVRWVSLSAATRPSPLAHCRRNENDE